MHKKIIGKNRKLLETSLPGQQAVVASSLMLDLAIAVMFSAFFSNIGLQAELETDSFLQSHSRRLRRFHVAEAAARSMKV